MTIPVEEQTPPQKPSIRVLFVDDHEDTTYAIGRQLRHLGYQVATAHDYASAWNMAQSDSYDAYILDIVMPEVDGMQLCRELKALTPDVPVIYYSALAREEHIRAAMSQGGDCYLIKPVNIEDLDAAIRKHIQNLPARR